MRYGQIPGVNKPVAYVVQGANMIGSDFHEAHSFELLDQAWALGCNTIETAHVYGAGESERIIGRWMESRGLREKIVIITKGANHSADRRRMTPFDIASDLHDSLTRLRTDFIDLFLLHRDDPDKPFEQIIEALNEHLQAGRIHAFGASNWSHQRIEAANKYARANGLEPFAASSPQFSLAEAHGEPWPFSVTISGPSEYAAREWYAKTQMPVLAWSPLATGFFSGRFHRNNLHTFKLRRKIARIGKFIGKALSLQVPMGRIWDEVVVRTYASEANFRRLDRAKVLSAEKGRTIAQIALAYVMNQPMHLFAVVGSHSRKELEANIEASEIQLTQQEIDLLDLRVDFPSVKSKASRRVSPPL